MSKRKAAEPQVTEKAEDIAMRDEADGGEDDAMEEIVDVDFEFFDPKPIDFHAIKRLLTQLFSADAELFNLSELAELIIGQPLVGSTVKVDGPESDPYSLLTVLNLNHHKEKQSIQEFKKYLLDKTKKQPIHVKLAELFADGSRHDVGWIVSERLVNMPVQIVPPMYKMLLEEVEWAVEDKEPYEFEWYVLVAPTYREIESKLDEEQDAEEGAKKSKKSKVSEPVIFYFHPEEEIIAGHSDFKHHFKLTKDPAVSDSKRTFQEFGILPVRSVFLLHKSKIKQMVEDLVKACASE
ncbi:uncharacterized protein VTP21DRAFT_7578 [Calcarisporiella thermophila]|uniref:uncharacterized protein n=1 Tax=Calcarisporiella thermophila TaxID=911321 RepID=UPI00374228E4